MSIHDSIRLIRESKHLSQEDMAEELNMSVSGYAKIERGVTKLQFDKLQKIAQIFNLDIVELITAGDKGVVFIANENKADNSSIINSSYYTCNTDVAIEIEKLNLLLTHQKELVAQKDAEIAALKEVIQLLKANQQ
ncbi:helix-turn-helix domain-containing protein [Moraxella sp. FZLJ2107]|uniref:helix-turn-helix domain-containing protein n=1 Tax=unclassified Moraxella TaxID=2685852 RepID=UPI00209C6C4F|nr:MULTISPECIES: helix-turn-helix transcriptional regulator [unclassified Moraxella]USZ14411.1 helix-turn-helix domain-containing protein [Moraxella sp. FZFQ2102]UTO05082.1 helix-turn-helix domain-containing protein [Moraxella sp. FZLJ2107]UTO21817.1 helix-turn-helix domain-containing protein [Moraxella sp. FZLJ2109]